MKLPQIRTKHKIRDAAICAMYVKAKHTLEEVALRFHISITRVYQIVYANRDYIQTDKEWEKSKRVHWLKRQIAKTDTTKKDTADLMEQLRKEIEGDKPLVDMSVHKHLTKVDVKISNDTRIPLAHKAGGSPPRQLPV